MALADKVLLTQTRSIIEFVPLLEELEFGDRFSLSMLHWCGIGKREYPLAFWEVYVAKLGVESVGIIGLYQQMDTPPEVVWVGWFGVRPKFRRQGFGTIMMNGLRQLVMDFKFKELWVFTEKDALPALAFYEKADFTRLGTAANVCPGKTHDSSDIILRLEVNSSALTG